MPKLISDPRVRLTEANRKKAKKFKKINNLKGQAALHTKSESIQMTENVINFRDEIN